MTMKAHDEVVKSEIDNMWCFHGTSLSTAQKVFIEGFRVGPSTDGGRTGVFVIGWNGEEDRSDGLCFDLARERAKSWLCTEWQLFDAPSLWSMPVVLMFQHPKVDVDILKQFSNSLAAKWVIRRDPGTYLPRHGSLRLMLDVDGYGAWLRLHYLTTLVSNSRCFSRKVLKDEEGENLVMCGGKVNNPYYWTKVHSMSTSCGRTCRVKDLDIANWGYAINAPAYKRIFRCPSCHAASLPCKAQDVLFFPIGV